MTEREALAKWFSSRFRQFADEEDLARESFKAGWQASRKQAADELAVLATFAHEILIGAYKPTVAMWKARAALERTGLSSLDSVVALNEKPDLATKARTLKKETT